ncbi:MAG TPA: hypothetical protein PK198_20485, partial [Saprospiraceae bacterium]|nr:hypothetical protein [Saprospiraceae bacterium]
GVELSALGGLLREGAEGSDDAGGATEAPDGAFVSARAPARPKNNHLAAPTTVISRADGSAGACFQRLKSPVP